MSLKVDVIAETSPVSDASVAGTNLGASFAGRLVLTKDDGFTTSCTEEEDTDPSATVGRRAANVAFATEVELPLRRAGGTYLDDMINTIL